MGKLDRHDWMILIALTSLAALLRLYQLGAVPPGFQFDEAFNALDAARVLAGDRPLFLPTNGGREVLYTYWQVALASVFGLNLYTLRLASALAGIAAVPATYCLLRSMLSLDGRRIAVLTSLVLTTSLWHLHFSHYGIRVVLMPVLFCGVVGFFWFGTREQRWWPYALSGALAGISVWNHPVGRLIPLVMIGYVGWLLWQHPNQRRIRWPGPLAGLGMAGLVAFLVFLPLGIEFYRHPDFFFGHPGQVSVLADRVSTGSPAGALARNVMLVLGMFSIRGDELWIHNLGGRPVFDLLMSIPFWLGLGVWLTRIWRRDDPDRDALVLLLLWAVLMLLPSAFSDLAPNFSRTLPALPALFLAAGLGLNWIVNTAGRRGSVRTGWAIAGAILVVSGILAVRDYFVRFPQAQDAYYAYDVDKLDAWSHVEALTADNTVYLSQLWAEHATLDFLRRGTNVKSLDTSTTVVQAPPSRGTVYAFPAEQAARAERIAALWPGDAALEQTVDRYGRPLLTTVSLPPDAARTNDVEPLARFAGAPSLQAMEAGPARGEVTLEWQADETYDRSLTSFIHFIDEQGRRVGQVDQLPGNGSYPTTTWEPGERVIERYQASLEPCAGDTLRVLVGWYDSAADATPLPRVDGPGTTALAGLVRFPVESVARNQLSLSNPSSVGFGPHLTLLGFEADTRDLQPGSTMTVDLAWEGDPIAGAESLGVRLRGETEEHHLWGGTVGPELARWEPGEAMCRQIRLRLPVDLQPGSYQLSLETAGHRAALTSLDVGPPTRLFELPPLEHPLAVTLDNQISLRGYEVETGQTGQPMTVTLVWQANTIPDMSYTAFVHLIDGDQQIVTQSDSVPADGHPTSDWLPGEVVLDSHALALPDDLVPGTYGLLAGLYDPLSGKRLPVGSQTQDVRGDDAVSLGQVMLP